MACGRRQDFVSHKVRMEDKTGGIQRCSMAGVRLPAKLRLLVRCKICKCLQCYFVKATVESLSFQSDIQIEYSNLDDL